MKRSVLHVDLLAGDQRIADNTAPVQVFVCQPDCCNLLVFVGGIVVDSLAGIAAGGIDGDLVAILSLCTAPCLVY